MKIVKKGLKLQARRVTDYTDFSFDSIPDIAFRIKGKSKFMADAQMKDEMFWEKHRSEELTQSETRVSLFLDRLQNMKGFKPIIWVGKAFIENFVETTLDPKKGSKIDYGPVNTTITHSDVDGLPHSFPQPTSHRIFSSRDMWHMASRTRNGREAEK